MKPLILLTLMLLMSIGISAQEFKNLQAKNAMEKYKAEIKKAEDIKEAAEVKLKKELTEALATAMKAGDLDEANKIKATLDGNTEGKEEAKAEQPAKIKKEKPKVETKLQKVNRLAIIGTWKRQLCNVEIKEDGTFIDTTMNRTGTWEVIDDEGNFKMTWPDGINTCTKPVNGKSMTQNGIELVKDKK